MEGTGNVPRWLNACESLTRRRVEESGHDANGEPNLVSADVGLFQEGPSSCAPSSAAPVDDAAPT